MPRYWHLGGVGFGGFEAGFSDIKVGYDTPRNQGGSAESDDDIDDPTDDIIADLDQALCSVKTRTVVATGKPATVS